MSSNRKIYYKIHARPPGSRQLLQTILTSSGPFLYEIKDVSEDKSPYKPDFMYVANIKETFVNRIGYA